MAEGVQIPVPRGHKIMANSLFEKCGGFSAVSKIVMQFYERVIDSDITGPYFDEVDMRALMDHQTKFISQVMGGPVVYSDDVLERVHAPLEIEEAAFEEMARLLRETLEEVGLNDEDCEVVMQEIEKRAQRIITRV